MKKFDTDILIGDYNYSKDCRKWVKKHGKKRYLNEPEMPKSMRCSCRDYTKQFSKGSIRINSERYG